jgi:hypothetical protein
MRAQVGKPVLGRELAALPRICIVMHKQDPKSAPPATDRRTGADRRHVDVPLPAGKRDRRRALEARKPDVLEIDMSQSEWAALSDLPAPAAPPKPPKK